MSCAPFRAAIAPGIGDAYWAFCKLGALRQKVTPAPVHLVLQANPLPRAHQLIELCPWSCDSWSEEPYKAANVINPDANGYGQTRILDWGYDKHGFDAFFWANEHLQEGRRLEEWFPDLAVDWDFPLYCEKSDLDRANIITTALSPSGRYMCLYTSGISHNTTQGGFNPGLWTPLDYLALVDFAWREFGRPTVLIGAAWDLDMAVYLSRFGRPYLLASLVGRTPLSLTVSLIRLADALVAFPSGMACLGVHMRTPTIMFWPDSRGPTRYGVHHKRGMQTAWVRPETLRDGTYWPVEYREATLETVTTVLAGYLSRPGREEGM